MSAPATPYIHGSDPAEQARLGIMNRILNPASLAALALREGERVLDAGSGTGILALEMARAVGATGIVVGIERDARQLAAAEERRRNDPAGGRVAFRAGGAESPPLEGAEWGSFDVAHARFLLEHVRDPLAVVRAMVRALRPGGRIVLADDDHDTLRLWPECPAFQTLWEAYWRSYATLGCDPLVGRKLPALLHAAGARPAGIDTPLFGACAGQDTFDLVVDNIRGVVEGALPSVLASGLIDAAGARAGLSAFDAWRRRPDASYWFVLCVAEGRRPDGG